MGNQAPAGAGTIEPVRLDTVLDGPAGEAVELRALDLVSFLSALRMTEGSDLHLKQGQPPLIRMDGDLHRLNTDCLGPDDVARFARESMPVDLWERFEARQIFEADYAFEAEGQGRFRVNCFRQRGSMEVVMRRVAEAPSSFAALCLPDGVSRLTSLPRGLVLVTGPTGSGKTTTLAAMVDQINRERPVHIVTIEDPIEIVHRDIRASVSQREVGSDTAGFLTAMRSVLRQDPDVILIGEIRDSETMQAALHASETGHLVLSTLHTKDAVETAQRVLDLFPLEHQNQARSALAANLAGVLSQRLLPRATGTGRVVACEVLFGSGHVEQAILENRIDDLYDVMARDEDGAQTFDQAVAKLVLTGEVSVAHAMTSASRPDDLRVILEHAGMRLR
ncbi:MAG: PilT/PilU family type 4a pilus ATPase [Acidimicrobiia bacterium]|nr:PilT/PilU family type 4a pilus ATPase [Acidimicrobiia bacterium]